MVLMLLAALGALSAFAGSTGASAAASPETAVVEAWRDGVWCRRSLERP